MSKFYSWSWELSYKTLIWISNPQCCWWRAARSPLDPSYLKGITRSEAQLRLENQRQIQSSIPSGTHPEPSRTHPKIEETYVDLGGPCHPSPDATGGTTASGWAWAPSCASGRSSWWRWYSAWLSGEHECTKTLHLLNLNLLKYTFMLLWFPPYPGGRGSRNPERNWASGCPGPPSARKPSPPWSRLPRTSRRPRAAPRRSSWTFPATMK